MRVIEELKRIYKSKIMPLEKLYQYDIFHSPILSDAEFDSKPQVMLIGQYSVGKTSFIRYLLGKDFPGVRIGPEPTTDRFVAVMDGPDERIIPGNALAISNDLPYRGLEQFGVAFLNRFEGSQLPSQVLRNITLIDTPGVLSGEKQRVSRGYDFQHVCAWFASRADLILLLFDAHKLDISDEFRGVIECLKGNDDKIRCILNKADQVDRQKLMRVYGALMWSMGKVMRTPEVLRVYVGSFWSEPLMYNDNAELFEMEEADLMRDLRSLPRNSAVRKINELVKRVRIAKVHAYIIGYLKEQMPMFMGKESKQKKLCAELPQVFRTVMKRHNLAPGDFPDIKDFKSKLEEQDFTKFATLKPQLIEAADMTLASDIPRLMEALPRSIDPAVDIKLITPTFVDETKEVVESNPFDEEGDTTWCMEQFVPEYKPLFEEHQVDGFVSGKAAKQILTASNMEVGTLRKIWDLSDIDKDGRLDLQEFVIAMFLTARVKEGDELPATLDPDMVPVEKR
eukprot:CAMPEP_0185026886 /NCGR_PEP_ID=MMETSP1103-20130426/11443_1 /TAXON_ID=36769 /ORGANISM="Paraphysomonas bandaiensis, Strain Caron Lab Isolate" /LENGTH=508 /DNA_ID=CAMNT_0027560621 /DNA_START=82 /DNA_END=1608 /DNA_ORIENTATION=+